MQRWTAFTVQGLTRLRPFHPCREMQRTTQYVLQAKSPFGLRCLVRYAPGTLGCSSSPALSLRPLAPAESQNCYLYDPVVPQTLQASLASVGEVRRERSSPLRMFKWLSLWCWIGSAQAAPGTYKQGVKAGV